ncbi:hypothetical protein [uncultured Phenylobacterium sp.]|uniref:hypothetical protein n=1 Tax=uncultured Phenylobacterium sp. TaxID=349273 RepID=UPI0025DA4E4B|nr:hypothetical protein [uncultured Phenylobacterium sp.]
MSLGRRLADEIGANDDRNTLDKWLAHHLAELIQSAETNPAAADRAVDTILRIWAQRHDLPGHAYPAARFDSALRYLGRLAPGANPWRPRPPKLDADVLGDVVDGLSRLVLTAIALQLDLDDRHIHEEVDLELLEPDEREIIETFSDILSALREQPRHPPLPRIIFKRFVVDRDGIDLKQEESAEGEDGSEEPQLGVAEEVLGDGGKLSDQTLMRLGLGTIAQVRTSLDAYEEWLLKKMSSPRELAPACDAED